MKREGKHVKVMRMIGAWLCITFMMLSFAPVPAAHAAEYDPNRPDILETEHLNCEAAILLEIDSGEVIFEKNADAMMYPASTTKILTTYLALTMADVTENTVVSPYAVQIPEDSSKLGLAIGEEINLLDLLYGTMLTSGNDGANAIAEAVSGSVYAFVDLMNTAADAFGCTATHFANAHGYHDENHYTTARDMAIIARQALKNETMRQIANTRSYVMPRDNIYRERQVNTTNKMIRKDENKPDCYYEYATGVKTGHHSAAGWCLVSTATKDGITLLSVVFNASSETRSYTDSQKLFNYGFTQYISTTVAEIYEKNPKVVDISGFALEDQEVGKLRLDLRKVDELSADMIVTTKTNLEIWSQEFHDRTVTEYTRAFKAPITRGEVMGTLTYAPEAGNPVVYELIASRSIEARESLAPTLEEIIEAAMNDPNPFPRFTFEIFVRFIAVPVLLLMVLFRFTKFSKRIFKKREKVKAVKPSERYYQ